MSNRSAIRSRTEVPFGREEWDLLVRLPGRVVVAATSLQTDTRLGTVAQGLAGIAAIAAGRASASGLVRDVVAAVYAEGDDEQPVAEEFPDRSAGIVAVLDACRTAGRLLNRRVGREECEAYGHWLEAIAARVWRAARTGGVPGLGGRPVSPVQQRFLAELGAAFRE
jgi:hypothetical protein